LYCFGRLTLKFLIHSVRRVHTEVSVHIKDSGSVILTGATAKDKPSLGKNTEWQEKFDATWDRKEEGWVLKDVATAAKALNILEWEVKEGSEWPAHDHVITDPESLVRVDNLVRVLRDVTTVGVQAFVLCAVVTAFVAFYKPIVDMTMNSEMNYLNNPAEARLRDPSPSMGGFMDGIGFFGSSIAIYNLLAIETSPDLHVYLEKYHPFYKFWGTKILVSIAYTQSLILSVVNAIFDVYSEQQVNLIYSTLIVWELVGICLLHYLPYFKAWHPNGRWLRTVEKWEKEYRAETAEAYIKAHPGEDLTGFDLSGYEPPKGYGGA